MKMLFCFLQINQELANALFAAYPSGPLLVTAFPPGRCRGCMSTINRSFTTLLLPVFNLFL